MSRREKIIILCMAIALLYGVINFFFPSSDEKESVVTEKGLKQLDKFVSEVSQNLSKATVAETNNYILARAAAEWKHEPFLRIKNPLVKTVETEPVETVTRDTNLTYTGYLETANKRLAIINGLEYEVGEALVQAGYFVRNIFPKRVVIGMEGKKRNIILPLEE
jgi:hypothetical protein